MRILYRTDDIRQLAHAGRLNQNAVGVVLLDHIVQRLTEVAHQRAADAARVHFVYHNAGILEKTAVNTDLTEFVFDQHHLLAFQGVCQQPLDQRGLTSAQKSRNNINFRHLFRLILNFNSR